MDWRRSAAVPLLLVYVLSKLFWTILNTSGFGDYDSPAAAAGLLKLGLWVVPSILSVMYIERLGLRTALTRLGLGAGLARGGLFGIAATLPMALVIPFGGLPNPRLEVIVDTLLFGPFAEEILFRGLLLTWLIHRANWRPATAILVSAAMFGMVHVPNADLWLVAPVLRVAAGLDPLSIGYGRFLGQVAALAAGGVLFGWVYYRWGSLWPAIGLHASINLWWDLSVGRPFPSDALQMAHGVAVILAVVLTLSFTSKPAKQTTGPAAVQPPGPSVSS